MGDAVQLLRGGGQQVVDEGHQFLSGLLLDLVVRIASRQVASQLLEFVSQFLRVGVVGLGEGLQVGQLVFLLFGQLGVVAKHLHPAEGLGKQGRYRIGLKQPKQRDQDGADAHRCGDWVGVARKEGIQQRARHAFIATSVGNGATRGVHAHVRSGVGAQVVEVRHAVVVVIEHAELTLAAPVSVHGLVRVGEGTIVVVVEHPVAVIIVEAAVAVLVGR